MYGPLDMITLTGIITFHFFLTLLFLYVRFCKQIFILRRKGGHTHNQRLPRRGVDIPRY